ncbi:MAG: hypothetical protein WCC87_01295 [Candidatus Korobacteraceae bacterium]
MALTIRYRYVDFGTVFTGAPGVRGAESGAESVGTLYANELVTDVGGTCWDRNEPLAIIDHHFSRDGQFPSASAAVLHKAKLIREKFAGQENEVVWLVTHKQPDFDAFCSLYLARWIIEEPNAMTEWEPHGLHPDGWLDCAGRRKIDWFDPDMNQVPSAHRWALLLSCYASIVDGARRLSCPRGRALYSILYAALKRGRDYLNDTSGAREFFDEVRTSLQEKQLNPMFDSVLEDSSRFAPELALLDREVDAYQRDIRRARKSIVYLPESEAPFPNFFKSVKDVVPPKEKEPGRSSETNTEHLRLTDTFRIPTDGIYLCDPECLLFKEWARLDLENSALGAGFEFTAIAYSGGLPAGTSHKSDYLFSIDPERAKGRHLYTVWSRLQTKEVEALRAAGQLGENRSQRGSEPGTGSSGGLFTDPWFDGQNSFGTIVAPPHRGTHIGPAGVRSDLRDDPVAEAVRAELENALYLAENPTTGPQVTLNDFGSSADAVASSPQSFDLDAPQFIPPPQEKYFRFATIPLRVDVPILPGGISRRGLTNQIAETLWQVLYPDLPYEKPAGFAERHLVVTADCVGVWGHRGIVIACKPAPANDGEHRAGRQDEVALRDDFASIVVLARDVARLIADGELLSHQAPSAGLPVDQRIASQKSVAEAVAKIIGQGEDLGRRAAQIKHNLTSPDRDLLRRFYDAIGMDELLRSLHNLNRAAAERLLLEKLDDQNATLTGSTEASRGIQSNLEWLEVVIVGFYATAILGLASSHVAAATWGMPVTVLGGLLFLLLAAGILRPWDQTAAKRTQSGSRSLWLLGVILLSYIVGLMLWVELGRNAG